MHLKPTGKALTNQEANELWHELQLEVALLPTELTRLNVRCLWPSATNPQWLAGLH